MKITHTILIMLFVIFLNSIAEAQKDDRMIVQKVDTLVTIPYCAVSAGYTIPSGEMGRRYKPFMDLGVDIGWKNKQNWIFSFNFGFQFAANNVKIMNDILSQMMTEGTPSFVVSGQGTDAGVVASNRNLNMKFMFGKVIPLWFSNVNSGLMITIGGGWLQHQILFQATHEIAYQLEGDRQYLYDRQMRGPMLSGFIGYLFFGKYSFANFYAGIQLDQAWTKMTRIYQADLRSGDTKRYSDRMLTFKAAWIFQFRNPTSERIYY